MGQITASGTNEQMAFPILLKKCYSTSSEDLNFHFEWKLYEASKSKTIFFLPDIGGLQKLRMK